jgi:prefoldin subunit 5
MDDHSSRIRDLEREFSEMRAENAALTASVRHLTESVNALTQVVGTLRDVMNQGRGALWLGMLLAGSVGATAVIIVKRLFMGAN